MGSRDGNCGHAKEDRAKRARSMKGEVPPADDEVVGGCYFTIFILYSSFSGGSATYVLTNCLASYYVSTPGGT